MKQCPRCKGPAELQAPLCRQCGHQFRTQFGPAPVRAPFPAPAIQQNVIVNAPAAAPASPQRYDTCAILSVIFGGVSWLFCLFGGGLFASAAVVLGILSLGRLKSDRSLGGFPMAVTGLALSVIPLLYSVYFVAYWVWQAWRARQP